MRLDDGDVVTACQAVQHHRHRRWGARLLWATLLPGPAFLASKRVDYRHEWQEGPWPGDAFVLHRTGARIFFMLYFVMAGRPAVHPACGMAAVALFARAAARSRAWVHAQRLEALALYWHFVDIVWLFVCPFLYLVERHP